MNAAATLRTHAAVFSLLIASSATAATPLSSYNVDPNSVSVSGLSSGGFMAVQLGVAYSSTFQVGFGVFAGGPFDCARNQNSMTCMYNMTPSITTPEANMSKLERQPDQPALQPLKPPLLWLVWRPGLHSGRQPDEPAQGRGPGQRDHHRQHELEYHLVGRAHLPHQLRRLG